MTNIDYLLDYCKGKEELYNQVANFIWAEFDVSNFELNLLCTYMLAKFLEEKGVKV